MRTTTPDRAPEVSFLPGECADDTGVACAEIQTSVPGSGSAAVVRTWCEGDTAMFEEDAGRVVAEAEATCPTSRVPNIAEQPGHAAVAQ
jgi:hypothetical protein